jgi:hypothetical protein
MDTSPNKPAWWWYVVAALVGLGGLAAFVVFLVSNLRHLDQGFTQVAIPGTQEVELREPGTYTVFHEYQSVFNNRQYSNQPQLPGLQLGVNSGQSNAVIPVTAAGVNSNYSLGSRAGISLFEFNIAAPGRYVISAQYADGTDGPEAVLAIGKGFTGRILKTVLGSFAILGGSLVASILIAVITFVKRRRAVRQLSSVPTGF